MSDTEFRELCEQLVEQEDWAQLKTAATTWKKSTEIVDEPITFLAEAEYQSGNPETAVQHLLSVPRGNRRSFSSLIAASEIQFEQLNRPLDGVSTLERMIEQRPWSTTSHQRLIFFYAITLQREKMLAAIDRAISMKAEPPDAYVYLLLAGKLSFSNGFAKNSQWLKTSPESELFQVARVIQLLDSVKTSDNEATVSTLPQYRSTFDALRKKYPQNIALLTYAVEEAAAEFDIEAVADLLSRVAEKADDSVLLKWRGWLHLQNGQDEEALAALLQSIEKFALDWRTWHDLAACYRKLGQLDEAARTQQIATVGKQLRKEVLQLKNAALISPETLEKLASYAASCGEDRVAVAILLRLRGGQTPEAGP